MSVRFIYYITDKRIYREGKERVIEKLKLKRQNMSGQFTPQNFGPSECMDISNNRTFMSSTMPHTNNFHAHTYGGSNFQNYYEDSKRFVSFDVKK
uniref:Uncharacterized protein n=1 Tax=Strongyloides venezuelensis TaxID=75913 RepID=A0A0K0F0B6_STRVS